MKFPYIFALALAVALYCAPAMAQHGHPGGVGGGMGGGAASSMGHGTVGHNANASNGTSMSHGKAMEQILTDNKALAGKIQTLTGMNATAACSGFRNLGQCVAAAHVSKNLGINFACLRADMTPTAAPSGTSCGASSSTSTKSMSLGKAIQTLRPTANSKAESKKAMKQAEQDINEANS